MSQITRMEHKLGLCVRIAREASRASWQEPSRYRDEFHRLVRESMEDARIWRRLLEHARKETTE